MTSKIPGKAPRITNRKASEDQTLPPTTSFESLWTDFARHLERSDRSPHTTRNYRSDLQGLARWFEQTHSEPPQLHSLTPIDLREYKRFLVHHCRLTPQTVNRKLSSLKTFFQWAARDLGLAEIPKIPGPVRFTDRGPRWLDRLEQYALVRTVERGGRLRDIALVKLLLNTGLRVGELCALLWSDVVLSERQGHLTVRQGKGSHYRQIPLNNEARRALRALGDEHHRGQPQPIVKGQRGPLTPRGVQNLLETYVRVAGLDGVSVHSLRHTFCKNLVNAGVSLEKVAALAGHASLDTTRRYCEPSLKDLQHSVDLIGEEE